MLNERRAEVIPTQLHPYIGILRLDDKSGLYVSLIIRAEIVKNFAADFTAISAERAPNGAFRSS